MTTNKHTPGPWKLEVSPKGVRIINANGKPVVESLRDLSFHDGKLMIAAPDLLAACEHIADVFSVENADKKTELNLGTIFRAINKAKGEG